MFLLIIVRDKQTVIVYLQFEGPYVKVYFRLHIINDLIGDTLRLGNKFLSFGFTFCTLFALVTVKS